MRLRILLALLLAAPVFGQTAPSITGVVSATDFGQFAAAAPGSWVEIYGSNLSGTTRAWAASDFSGANAPTALDGVTVKVNGVLAYPAYISPGQINFQMPAGLAPGTASVVVSYGGLSSAPAQLTVTALEPGLLSPPAFKVGTTQYIAAYHAANNGLISNGAVPGIPASLAVPGETVILYGVGFGPVTPGGFAGILPSGLTALTNAFAVTVGGVAATVQYAGLTPGVAGLYQFNVVLPASLPAGNLPVQFTLGGAPYSLQTLVLPVAGTTSSSFTLTSAAGLNGGTLPSDYTCDGMGSTIQLSWKNAPAGTQEFALLMTTLPGDGTTKWNWVVYNIPSTATNIARDSFLVGTTGIGSDGPGQVYNPPCSQGPGAKLYTWTIYALSAPPAFSVAASQVTGQMVTDAIAPLTLGTATLNLSYTRATSPTGSSAGCVYVMNSVRASKSGNAVVACDGTYAYVGSNGITTAPMMNGITSTNLQVPTPQNFNGANAWKIPLNPALAATTTPVVDGPIGVAINGVPIFNPCTQGGCVTGGDTKALGQLDTCNGHAGRADDYHYHAAPTCLMADQPASYWNTHPLGWALDGFAIFGYNNADGTTATRDSLCGGNTSTVQNAPAGYSYHVTDSPPYINSCLAGTPSPDLPNQASKYKPMRQPPVTPFNDSAMTLTTDPTDGYQVLQFTSAIPFTTNETGSDSYKNTAGTYKIRYKQVTGADLAALLAQKQNANATACWNFQFVNASGATTQPSISYCR